MGLGFVSYSGWFTEKWLICRGSTVTFCVGCDISRRTTVTFVVGCDICVGMLWHVSLAVTFFGGLLWYLSGLLWHVSLTVPFSEIMTYVGTTVVRWTCFRVVTDFSRAFEQRCARRPTVWVKRIYIYFKSKTNVWPMFWLFYHCLRGSTAQ